MKYLLLFLIGMSSLSLIGQDKDIKAEIKTACEEYMKVVEAKDVEGTMDFMHPKMFEMVPRKALSQMMTESLNDEENPINFSDSKILGVSDVIEEEGLKYALADYSFVMQMPITEKDFEDKEGLEFMMGMFESMYGEENIKLNEEIKAFEISVTNQMFVIEGKEGWKFLENKESMAPVLEMIIPKKVMKKLTK